MNIVFLIFLLIHTITETTRQKDNNKYPQTYFAALNDIPYHVLIVYDNLYCSGSLIRSKMVITAASCFGNSKGSTIIVKVGSQTTTDFGQVIEVIEVKKHEYYGRHSVVDNDIAILMLKEHVAFRSYVKKVIVVETVPVSIGTALNVSGWGSANLDVKYMNKLLSSEMVVISDEECEEVYLNLKTAANFCLKYQQTQVLSDNGGPAVYRDKLVGIVSYGADSSHEPYVTLVTNVSYFYKWIELNVERLLKRYCVPLPDYEYYYTDSMDYN